MVKTEVVKEFIERRTYFKGRFIGKYWADLDFDYSDGQHENFYQINIYEGEVHARKTDFKKWYEGQTIKGFNKVEVFSPALPKALTVHVSDEYGSKRTFKAEVHEVKLIKYELYNKQQDNDQSFGTIAGEIAGYLVHYEEIEVEIQIQDAFLPEDEVYIAPKAPEKYKTNQLTGKKEEANGYIRYEFYYSDGTPYWGTWTRLKSDSLFSFWDILWGLFFLCAVLVILIPFLYYSWKLVLTLIGIYLLFSLFSAASTIFRFVGRWLLQMLSLGMLLLFVIGLFNVFKDGRRPDPAPVVDNVSDTPDEQTQIQPNPQNPLDSIITHTRNWVDYNDNNYSAKLKVLVQDFKKSEAYRNAYPPSVTSVSAYNQLVQDLHIFDKGRLDMVYAAFDSIKIARQLNEYEFAEMVVSCVQDIPYVLLLDQACNAQQYQDEFTRNYLRESKECDGNIKYGIRNPVEFIATLKGDCDTRTLLIYTVLQRFNYDIAILGSEMYSHSTIAINLPYRGLSKTVNGKRYVLWETTAPQMRPGEFPRDMADMRFWSVNLISR